MNNINNQLINSNSNYATVDSNQSKQNNINSSSSPSSSSRRELLSQKAINISSKLLTKSSNYLSSKNLDSLSNPFNRVNQSILNSSNHQSNHIKNHSRHKSNESWQEWDNHISNWNMKVGGQPVPEQTSSSSSNRTSIDSINHNNTPITSSSSRPLSFFHPQNWQKKPKESIYSEDHLVCFPGFVALRSPSYSRAGDIQVFISIHAFRARPTLDHLNRSQRLIYSMICKITGLPPLPLKRLATPLESNHRQSTLMEDDWIASDDEQREKMHKFEPLLPTNSTPNRIHRSSPYASLDDNTKFDQMPSVTQLNTQLSTPPTKITCTAPTPVQTNRPSLPPRPSLSRSSSTSSSKSSNRFFGNERPSSYSNSVLASNLERLNEQFRIENEDLTTLHMNLKERLHSFFSQGTESSKVRIKLYGICSSKATDTNVLTKKTLFRSRLEEPDLLTPKLDPDEFIINNGRPLLTQVITTRAGGVWQDKLVIPWQTIETHLSFNRKQAESKLADNPFQSQSTCQKASPQNGVIRLRIEAELINDQPPNDLRQRGYDLFLDQSVKSDAVNRKLSIGKPALSMELDVIPALAESIHVISDIDDTIKHTHVLGGMKYVFQHVFLAEFEQVAITGMAEWYQSLRELGCWIHYISNSPLELWYCVEGFLAKAGFPRGSVSLKEYARGATSILSGMWESAGARKRARVEAIVKQFPNSRFICIGDSGEQDLEMYVSLAQAYPGRIISIYIRDVTSPAILGKEISIDQILSRNHRLSTSDLPGGQPRRTSRFGMGGLSTSRPSSPDDEAAIPTNASPYQKKSHEVSRHSNLSGAKLSTITPVNKPTVPPKPSHLSSKRSTCAADANNPLRTRTESNKSLSLGLDPPLVGGSSWPSSVCTPMDIYSDYQASASSMTEKGFNSLSLDPCLTESDDPKTQNLLEAFINRVQKARSDLNHLNLNPDISAPRRNSIFFDDELIENGHLAFIPTKLKFFRNGREPAVLESIQEVRNILTK